MLNINFEKNDRLNSRILTFAGEWDVYERDKAEHHFDQVLAETPHGLVVDLSDLMVLDSSGVEILITYFSKLKEAGIRMVMVTNHNNYIIKKFRNLGIFNQVGFMFYETIDEAEAELSVT